MNSLLVAPSLNLGCSSPPFFGFIPFSTNTIVWQRRSRWRRSSDGSSHKTSRHRWLDRCSDLNGCVKVLIEHLGAWGWTHWSHPLFSLGPDKEYWCSHYGSAIWDFAWTWSFSLLSKNWSFGCEWTTCFFSPWCRTLYWCKYGLDKTNRRQISLINGLPNWLICLRRRPRRTKCFITSVNKSVWRDSTLSLWGGSESNVSSTVCDRGYEETLSRDQRDFQKLSSPCCRIARKANAEEVITRNGSCDLCAAANEGVLK